MISLILDPSLYYPEGGDHYSPDEHFPEYRFDHISTQKNPVYRAIRENFLQAGLDKDHAGTAAWNPLGEYVTPGSRVFVLCNFANERRSNERLEDFWSRCTHGSVIRAVIDYLLIAVGEGGSVNFGNAPTQFCHWQQVQKDTGADEVAWFYQSKGIAVEACDLRLCVTDATTIGSIRKVERRDESMGVHIDLGIDSLLSELDGRPVHRYRVMNYDPKRTEGFHSDGKHEYVVNRKILESDVIFSIPKLKTHEKVGISCALKGFVGTVGHKDSLPHHRYGSPAMGGDEYPADRIGVLRFASAFHEKVQQTTPDTALGSTLRASYRILKRTIRPWNPVIEGAWWGNDTAWRMVLDLVRIATYCSADGKMQATPCRKHLALIDGILGGEGEGPAYPTAVNCGVLSFGDNLPAVDTLNALLMGFDPEKIPLVREAVCLTNHPLLLRELSEEKVIFNGRTTSIDDFRKSPAYRFQPSDGWKERLST